MRSMFCIMVLAWLSCHIALASTTRKCRLFNSNPTLRKVAKKFVTTKFFSELRDYEPIHVRRDRSDIYQYIIKVIPPSPIADVNDEIEAIHSQFKTSVLEENEFSSLILANSLWERAGETVVKELIYLDSLQHSHLGCPILSEPQMDALKQSLVDDGSIVPNLTASEAIHVCAIASVLSGTLSKGLEGKSDDDRRKVIRDGVALCKQLSKKYPDRVLDGPSLIFNILMNLGSSNEISYALSDTVP